MVLTKGNVTIKVATTVLAYLKHTLAMGFTTYGPGVEAPDSFKAGMQSDKAESMTMWRCNSWGAKQ